MLIGISGGGGDLAQRTIHQLIRNGKPPSQLVVTSRNPEKLKAFIEQRELSNGFKTRRSPQGMARACQGLQRRIGVAT